MKFSVNFKFPYITHKAIWLPNESDVISTWSEWCSSALVF